MKIARHGLLIVLSSPSGAGKTSLANAILSSDQNIAKSISYTTRLQRPGEIDGQDYFFIKSHEFEKKLTEGEFLEHAKVFDNYYATPKSCVEQNLKAGRDIIFDIDWQGTQQLAQSCSAYLVPIFILPPSVSALKERLELRQQDDAEIINNRMKSAQSEISHWAEYKYAIINENFEKSVSLIQNIISAERLKRHRQIGLADFVNSLRDEM